MTNSTPQDRFDRDDGHLLFAALRRLDLATSRVRSAAAHDWGVTVPDSLVMSHLAAAGGAMTPGDLARSLMMSSGTMTTMLDRLEAGGYVHRAPHPDDRRSLHIELTEAGRRALTGHVDVIAPALISAIDPAARHTVREALLALATALDRIDLEADAR